MPEVENKTEVGYFVVMSILDWWDHLSPNARVAKSKEPPCIKRARKFMLQERKKRNAQNTERT